MARNSQKYIAEVNLNGRPAINNLDKLTKAIKTLDKEAKRLKKNKDLVGADATKKKADELRKVVRETQAEVKNIDKAFSVAGKSVAGLENALKLATEKWRRLTNEADRNKMATRIRAIKDELNKLNGTLGTTAQRSKHAFGALAQRAAEYTGFYMLFNRGRQIITNAIQGNLKLSDSISDIQKVSGLTEDQVKDLVGEIEKLDSRNAPEVLNNMAYAAGKLGVKGADNLLGFTRAADKLSVALKEYLGEGPEGIVRLMKFADLMGSTKKFGIEDALLKTGSALNYMTQNTAAAADYMIDFSSRMGGMARAARMSEGDVIGLASACDALSQNNEMAATSLQKFTMRILSHPTAVAKAINMDAAWMKQMIETGNATEVIMQAFEHLGQIAEKHGVSGIANIIGDVGSKGQAARLTQTLMTLATNAQMVRDYVGMANDAFAKGTSVIEEYNIKNENAAAIWERMKNSWQKVMVNSSNVGMVKELAQEFYDVSKSIQNNTIWMTQLKVAFGGLITLFKYAVKFLPEIILYLETMAAVKLITWLAASIKGLWGLRAAFIGAATAGEKFKVLFSGNWMGLIAVGITTLISLFGGLTSKISGTASITEKLNTSYKNFETNARQARNEARLLFSQLERAKKGTEERTKLINKINKEYGEYLPKMLTEKSNAEEIAEAYKHVNTQLRQKLALQAREKAMEEATEGDIEGQVKATQRIQEMFRKGKGNIPKMFDIVMDDIVAETDRLVDQGKKFSDVSDSLWKGLFYIGREGETAGKYAAVTKTLRDNNIHVSDFQAAVQEYARNIYNERVHSRQVDKKYSYAVGRITETEDEPGRIELVEDFSKEERAAETERKKWESLQRKEMEKEFKGIKSLLESFYELRAAAINDAYNSGKIKTAMERDMFLDENKVRMANTVNAAWRFLLGEEGGEAEWKTQFDNMSNEILRDNEDLGKQMTNTWNLIGKVEMTNLASLLNQFGTSLTGGMRKTISTNEKLISESGASALDAIRKEMEKDDYIAQVLRQYTEGLQRLYLFRTKWDDEEERWWQIWNEKGLGAAEAMPRVWKDAVSTSETAIKELAGMYDNLFTIDIEDATGKGVTTFRKMLTETKSLSEQYALMSDEHIKLLYYQVMKLGDDLAEATKKQTDRQKKIIDERWKRDPRNLIMQRAISGTEASNKTTTTITGKWGIQSTEETQDAEIRLYALRLQAAVDYYTKLKEEKADQRLLDEAELKVMESTLSLQEKMAAKMTELQTLFADAMNTLPEYGTALGEAFAKSDPEERADAFKEAQKEILKSLSDATKKMIIEWVKQRIQHSIQQQLMAKDSKQAGQEEFNITTTAQTAIANAKAAIGQQILNTQQQQSQTNLATNATETQGNVALGIASGAAKTIGELGWWGVPLVAVITALLNGLLAWALGSIFKEKSSSTSEAATKNALRLVPGMLTYDSGNVQTFQQASEGGQYTVLGNDGRVYSARKQSELKTGIVSSPIATMVGGQPALVAEKGPEMIIGRKTLRDMTQFRPDLLQQIIKFDRNHGGFHTYDSGNVADFAAQTTEQLTNSNNMEQMQQTMGATLEVLALLTQQLQKGIKATINKYGTGGLVEEVADGMYVTKKKGTNTNINRLFKG